MGTRKVTVADAIEAMRQNNIPVVTAALTKTNFSSRTVAGYRTISGACAVGQCAINLGAEPAVLELALFQIPFGASDNLGRFIERQNDTYSVSPDKVAKMVLEKLTPEQLAQTIEFETDFSIVALKTS